MKRIIKNNYKIIIGILIGILLSVTSVYAIETYIESNKVTYKNNNKNNVQEAIDELYEKSGMHQEKWIDPILNGADPVLKSPLIPVEIKNDGEVYYANQNSEWYNYSEKRWANAVILTDTASKYSVGQQILDKDIKGYFVWIPRYSYKIWNLGSYNSTMSLGDLTNAKGTSTAETSLWGIAGNNTRLIDIKFVGTNISEVGNTIGSYLTHPAFKLGNKNLSGIWVGKFETGGTSASNMVVKPDVYSWKNQNIKVFFDAGKNFATTLDSHMMKNTEWGAVAYLSHSAYGIGNEVNINNASDYKTGYSAAPETIQTTIPSDSGPSSNGAKTQPWNTPVGYLASTTGNISGVYDMSGGVWEYMAACMDGEVGASTFDLTTLASEMAKGYIDKYSKDDSLTSYNRRILGDATGELGPFYNYYEGDGTSYNHSSWYSDSANFISSTGSWFHRGSSWNNASLAGQFAFYRNSGAASGNGGFRLVLAPINN